MVERYRVYDELLTATRERTPRPNEWSVLILLAADVLVLWNEGMVDAIMLAGL